MLPDRSDWLSNLWSYIKSVEEHVSQLDHRVHKIERGIQTPDEPISLKPVDPPFDVDD